MVYRTHKNHFLWGMVQMTLLYQHIPTYSEVIAVQLHYVADVGEKDHVRSHVAGFSEQQKK